MRDCVAVLLLTCLTAFAPSVMSARGAQDSINEISLERTGCYGPCPVYKVTLRRHGTFDIPTTALSAVRGGERWKVSVRILDMTRPDATSAELLEIEKAIDAAAGQVPWQKV